jgi:hypothetical protein
MYRQALLGSAAALELIMAPALELELEPVLALELVVALELVLELELIVVLELAVALVLVLDLELALDLELVLALEPVLALELEPLPQMFWLSKRSPEPLTSLSHALLPRLLMQVVQAPSTFRSPQATQTPMVPLPFVPVTADVSPQSLPHTQEPQPFKPPLPP